MPFLSLREWLSPVLHLTPATVEPRVVDIGRVGFWWLSMTPRTTGLKSWREMRTVAEGQD